MKNKNTVMKNVKIILTAFVVTTFLGCSNSDYYTTPDLSGTCSDLTATRTTDEVLGIVNNSLQQFGDAYDNDIIEAYVTSSDEGGNFFKSLSLVSIDGTKGFNIPIDAYNLYNRFEPGRKVYIKLKDRHYQINEDTDSKEIGSFYSDDPTTTVDDAVGRISGVEYQDVIIRGCTNVPETTLVNNFTIVQAKNDSNLNKLIEFNNVQFTDESLGKKYYDTTLNDIGGATNHEIIDEDGNRMTVRVSSFATFAGSAVPSFNGKLRGVLTKFNGAYQFMIRTLNDVQLTNPRIVPLYEESFSTNFPSWIKFSVTGAQVWSLDTQFGNPGSCARMSGFANNTNNPNEDWLISPPINLSSASIASLSFDNASRFAGNLLETYISTNYTSGNPSTATWVLLTGITLDTNTNAYVWTNSGEVNIDSYTGNNNVRIAFKYTSTNSASRTWEVDNVKITGQ